MRQSKKELGQQPRNNFFSSQYKKLIWPLALSAFLAAMLVDKIWVASQYKILVWDSYVYLLNGRVFEAGYSPFLYFELLRPPLFPYIISIISRGSGESIALTSLVNPILTVGAGVILYKWCTEMFNQTVGAFSAAFFLTIPLAFFWTNQILAHGVMIFFFTLSLYSLWKAMNGPPGKGPRNLAYYALAGVGAGLSSITRYPALVILPIASVYIVLILFVKRRNSPRRIKFEEMRWILIGIALFALIWVPWLVLSAKLDSGNPLASLQAGFSSAEAGSSGPWYYYIIGIPSLLGIPGTILLVIGMASKRTFSNPGVYLLLLWIAGFLAVYSLDPKKMDRFYSDWVAPLAILMAIGLNTLISFLEKRRRYLKVLAIGFTIIWLSNLAYVGNQASIKNAVFLRDYFESRDLVQASAWLTMNMNQTSLGASNLGPYFSWFTDRNFMPIDAVLGLSASQGITINEALLELHITYVVISKEYPFATSLSSLEFVTTIGDFLIYHTLSSTI